VADCQLKTRGPKNRKTMDFDWFSLSMVLTRSGCFCSLHGSSMARLRKEVAKKEKPIKIEGVVSHNIPLG
jgi:hypothetical protein